MKFRNGFVSNSSSSSFIICGVKFDDLEAVTRTVMELYPSFYNKNEERIEEAVEDGCPYELSELLDGAFGDADITIKSGEDESGFIVGVESSAEGMSVKCALTGFVSADELKVLESISSHVDRPIITDGGVEYG